ncbi:MAG: hypothetical protein F6K41_14975 [Symploca sp. SIO3E6]|nr:hypothetical protein [Caldora sp. SIO3E6]
MEVNPVAYTLQAHTYYIIQIIAKNKQNYNQFKISGKKRSPFLREATPRASGKLIAE